MYTGRFEPAIPAASQQQLTHALDRADTGNCFVEYHGLVMQTVAHTSSTALARACVRVRVCVCEGERELEKNKVWIPSGKVKNKLRGCDG